MKNKEVFLFVVFTLIIFLSIVSSLTEESITGEVITGEVSGIVVTGKAAAQSTNVSIVVVADSTPPTHSNNQASTTIAGASVLFSILWDDNTALDPNGIYIFSWNNSGVFVNDSSVNFTVTPEWANVTKTLNTTSGLTIGYQWYANDSAGNTNNTQVFILTTTTAPVEEPLAPSPGGGGGVVTPLLDVIRLDKETISITLKQGETKSERVVISNVGTSTISVTLSSSRIDDFLRISEESFLLSAGENKTIILFFTAGINKPIDLYQGRLIVRAVGNIEKEVLIAIGVESRGLLFDISAEIPEGFLEVVPGEELLTNIEIFGLRGEGKVDILLEYLIRDEEGNIIVSDTETISFETQASFVKRLKIPLDTEKGNYLFYVKATYNFQSASASVWFIVREKLLIEKLLPPLAVVLIVGIIILIIILLLMLLLKELQKREEFF